MHRLRRLDDAIAESDGLTVIQVSRVVIEIAARNLHAQTVTLLEEMARRQEIDLVFVDLVPLHLGEHTPVPGDLSIQESVGLILTYTPVGDERENWQRNRGSNQEYAGEIVNGQRYF